MKKWRLIGIGSVIGCVITLFVYGTLRDVSHSYEKFWYGRAFEEIKDLLDEEKYADVHRAIDRYQQSVTRESEWNFSSVSKLANELGKIKENAKKNTLKSDSK